MRYLLKTVFTGVIIGLVIAAIFIIVQVLGGRTLVFNQAFIQEILYYVLYSVVLSLLNGTYFDYLNHKVRWKKYARYKMIIGATGSIVITMLGIFFVRIITKVGFEGKDWNAFINDERAVFYVIALLITIVISIFFHAVYFYREIQKNKVKEQKIIATTASAQFDALKNQLDPHFLFNSLNVLTSLIEEDPRQAQRFTTSLSKVYRYVLEQKNKELVTVEEELRFARTYVNLLKMRFEESIIFELPEQASNPEAKVVPLSLQLLLENAVKHNMVMPNKPLKITIYEEEGNLVVQNNLQPKQVVKKSSGVGLRNIQQRYAILTHRNVIINKTPSEFSVRIPMLTKKVSTTMKTQETYIEDKRYQRAKERVEAIKGFYGNLVAYVIVIPFLWYLNSRTTDFTWAIFPTLGWGFGVIMHGLETYGYSPLLGKNWEERKIKEYMDKDKF